MAPLNLADTRHERVDIDTLASAMCYLSAATRPAFVDYRAYVAWPLPGPFLPHDDVVDNLKAVVEIVNAEIERIESYRKIDREELDRQVGR